MHCISKPTGGKGYSFFKGGVWGLGVVVVVVGALTQAVEELATGGQCQERTRQLLGLGVWFPSSVINMNEVLKSLLVKKLVSMEIVEQESHQSASVLET